MANNHSLLLADALQGNTVPEPQEDEDEDDQADEEEDQILVSADEEINILEHNTDWWESHRDHLVSYNARGYKCAGPALGTTHFIVQGCPVAAIIDFDTALIRRSRGRRLPTMSLDSRCASCHAEMRVRQLIKRFDSPKIDPKAGLGDLTKTFHTAISKTWTCTKDYERRVRQPVREGLCQNVVIIDNEFDPVTRELYETAIIDRVSGKTLLNTLITHTEETKSAAPSRRTQGEKVGIISQLWKKKVYGRSRGLTQLDVHQVAKRLRQIGITPKTIFLAWHVSCADLQILRDFLAKGGYHNILPKDKNCFPLIPLFRANVPKGCFPLRLEVVYPVMFPRSDLCGRNHRAIVDCEQTRDICIGLDNFCEPVENRDEDWQQPTRVAKKVQRSILDYVVEGKR
ncbi:zinc finger protein [Fusarium coicis]|nr:zinc finger protein [Fusarium coicis]